MLFNAADGKNSISLFDRGTPVLPCVYPAGNTLEVAPRKLFEPVFERNAVCDITRNKSGKYALDEIEQSTLPEFAPVDNRFFPY